MAFKRTGDAVVQSIVCSCGSKLKKGSTTCSKCGKKLVATDPETPAKS